jgi:hypothetical protein
MLFADPGDTEEISTHKNAAVMARLVRAIHELFSGGNEKKGVDGRDKPGHDELG